MMAPAAIGLRSVVFDCPDPPALASFYADLIAGQVVTIDPDWCEVHFAGSPFKLAFQHVTSYVPPAWPDGVPQQLHLDLTVSDLDAACRRAASLGAVVLSDRVEEPGSFFIVFADPAGHTFCLCQDRQLREG
jgi:predicted enzyme related to lactoylglutathione lyase